MNERSLLEIALHATGPVLHWQEVSAPLQMEGVANEPLLRLNIREGQEQLFLFEAKAIDRFDALYRFSARALGLDPFATCAYVFSNRRRNRVKILLWEQNGFWLLMKRLEEHRFIWHSAEAIPTLTVEQLHWLLQGIDIAVVQRHPQSALRQRGLKRIGDVGTMMGHADPSGRAAACHHRHHP